MNQTRQVPDALNVMPNGLTVTVTAGDLVVLAMGPDEALMRQQSVPEGALVAAALARAVAFTMERLAAAVMEAVERDTPLHH